MSSGSERMVPKFHCASSRALPAAFADGGYDRNRLCRCGPSTWRQSTGGSARQPSTSDGGPKRHQLAARFKRPIWRLGIPKVELYWHWDSNRKASTGPLSSFPPQTYAVLDDDLVVTKCGDQGFVSPRRNAELTRSRNRSHQRSRGTQRNISSTRVDNHNDVGISCPPGPSMIVSTVAIQ